MEETFNLLKEKQKEIASLPESNLGRFTPYYKEAMPFFKLAPWRLGIVLAFLGAAALSMFFGDKFIKLSSLIFKGF